MAAEQPVGAVDFAYLEGFTAGDATVVAEVLVLFRQQAESWAPRLDPTDPGWRDLAHTIKGAARGVGARTLGDACERAEAGEPQGLEQVRAELARALAEIAAYQARGG